MITRNEAITEVQKLNSELSEKFNDIFATIAQFDSELKGRLFSYETEKVAYQLKNKFNELHSAMNRDKDEE